MNFSKTTRKILILCCMCLCCMFLFSCISAPGEKDVEKRNIAAEYYDIAMKYVDQKQYDKAVSCFEKARTMAASADYVKIDYQMARAYALSNKWKEASDLFGTILEQDPGNSNVKEAYAYTLYKGGDKEKALQLYAELGKPDPFVQEEDVQQTDDQEAIGS